MTIQNEKKIIISGAGPVGTLMALSLLRQGIDPGDIAIFDGKDEAASLGDWRMIAISAGSRRALEGVNAWRGLDENPIHRIHVSQRGVFGRTLITAQEYGISALGYVVRYGAICAALYAALKEKGVAIERPSRIESVDQTEHALVVHLSQGRDLNGSYLIHAEGGLFREQGSQPIHRDYRQTAIMTWVSSTHPIQDQAWERFTNQGPIALLPTRHQAQLGYTLVWCSRKEQALKRMQMTDDEFLATLHVEFGDRVGQFTAVGKRFVTDLGLNAAPGQASGREFAIGNASQTLHPVAGQGMNLGFRDALVLARSLAQHGDDPAKVKQSFAAGRRTDRMVTVGLTDLLARAFATTVKPSGWAGGLALTLLDLNAPLRQLLATHMMDGQRSD